MAVVTESITLSRSSRLPISLPPAMNLTSSRLSVFVVREIQSLLGFKGLRIQLPLKSLTASSSSRVPKVSRLKTNIVCEAQKTALDFPTVNDTTWHSLVLNGDGPVLVEFWAPWCGPCRMLHPVIGEVALQYTGKLKCFKVNTDECPNIATQYGIRSIPTIMIFINGQKKETVIGAVPISTLIASIEKFL